MFSHEKSSRRAVIILDTAAARLCSVENIHEVRFTRAIYTQSLYIRMGHATLAPNRHCSTLFSHCWTVRRIRATNHRRRLAQRVLHALSLSPERPLGRKGAVAYPTAKALNECRRCNCMRRAHISRDALLAAAAAFQDCWFSRPANVINRCGVSAMNR